MIMGYLEDEQEEEKKKKAETWLGFFEQFEYIFPVLAAKGYSKEISSLIFMLNRVSVQLRENTDMLQEILKSQGYNPPEFPGDTWRKSP